MFNMDDSTEISIAWANLRLETAIFVGVCRRQQKTILRRLNGHFVRHSLNALMGPSGAGKTSLLNCLFGTLPSGSNLTPESRIHTNSEHPIVSYFIDQNATENVISSLTVREILYYAFRFKNSSTFISEKAETHILNVLDDLLLNSSILDRKFALCSGGEQKRVTIAQELMSSSHQPDFLFLDEPTTGLDSLAAYEVIRSLKRLSQLYPMTIVASIHAPNPATLELIDQLYILAKGGVCIYSGPPGNLPQSTNSEKHEKPIEALIKLAGKGLDEPQVQTLADHYLNENFRQLALISGKTCFKQQSRKRFHPADFLTLVCRSLRIRYISEGRQLAGMFLLSLAFLLGIASFFDSEIVLASGCVSKNNDTSLGMIGCDQDSYRSVNVLRNYLLMVHIFQTYFAVCAFTYFAFYQMKATIYEHRNRWYSLGAYYLSSTVTHLLFITLLAAIFAFTSYFAIGHQGADCGALNPTRISHYFASTWLTLTYISEIGIFFGVLVSFNIETAILSSVFVYNILLLLSDFAFQTDQLPHPLLVMASDVGAGKYCFRYFNYAIFAIDRCPAGEESWVLQENSVNAKPFEFYIWRILENILVVRLTALAVLYVRFNGFNLFRKMSNSNELKSELKFIPINADFPIENIAFDSCSSLGSVPELKCEAENQLLVAWRNLTLFESSPVYYRQSGNNGISHKRILCSLDGEFRTGSLNVIMGASGAGKTSLLKTLNGRLKSRLSPETRFYLSTSEPISTCFITQNVTDHLFPALTVKQNLVYASRFKNRQLSTKLSHEQIAEDLLAEFGMSDAGSTRVGHCSGGERKRLALALELTALRMPNLVCFDEPTSGLDSGAAEAVMTCFKTLVRRHNIALIASIHQPTTRILELLDQLYILAPGGVCVYSGPSVALDSVDCLLNQSYAGAESRQVQALAKSQKASLTSKEILLKDTQLVESGIPCNRTRFSLASVWILSCRYAAYFRAHWWMEATLASILFLAYGINMIIFFDTRKLSEYTGCIELESFDLNQICVAAQPAIDSESYIFFANNMFLLCVALVSTIGMLREFSLFYNEHRNGWYSSGAFYLQKSLFDFLPFVPVFALYVYIIDIYERDIYWHLLTLYLIQIAIMQPIGYLFVLISGGQLVLIIINILGTTVMFGLLSGALNPIPHQHYVYQLLSNLSVFRWALEAQALLQFGFGRCESGLQFYLAYIGVEDADFKRALWMLAANFVFYRLLAGYLLIVRANPREHRKAIIRKISIELKKEAC